MRTLVLLPTLLAFVHTAAAGQLMASHPPTRSQAHEVARVNGVPITSDRLDVALRGLIPMESFHRNVSVETVNQLRQKALDGLVDEELRYQDGVRRGLTPSDAEIEAGVARVVEGYKSRDDFEQARRRSGASMSEIRQEIRRAVVIKKAYEREIASRCQVGADEAARFYAENPDRFVMPEQLHVYAITIGVDPGSPVGQWTEARGRAEDVLRQIRGGASFEDMARKYSTDQKSREKGGDQGLVHRGSLTDAFEEASRDMKPGDVSGVVQTLYGYHIVKVASIRPPERKTLSDVSALIQKDLSTKRCAEMNSEWIARLRAGATIVLVGVKGGAGVRTSGTPGGRQ
jgi:peptidyl-prolyl cis-trans isomerase C